MNLRWRGAAAVAATAVALVVTMVVPASAATVLNEIDLAITKTASAPTVGLGGAFSYTLGVVNNGPSTAPTVQVTDTLPANQAFVGAVSTQGVCASVGAPAGATVTCDLGEMLPNAPVSITIDVTMAALPAQGLCSTNTATVADVTGVVFVGEQEDEFTWPDTDLTNNQASAEVCIPQIDLELTKSVDQAVVPLGTAVTWTIGVVNKGPNDATGVTVTDAFPPGVTYVSDNGGGAFNAGTGVWTIGNLALNATASLAVTTTVDTEGVKINRAQIASADQPDIDSTPANCPAVPGALGEDDCADAEVGTVLQATTTTTTTTVPPPTTAVADTLPKTGIESSSLAGMGLAAVLLGLGLVLAVRKRETANEAKSRSRGN